MRRHIVWAAAMAFAAAVGVGCGGVEPGGSEEEARFGASCSRVRCGSGLRCDDSSGRARCVPRDAGVEDAGTRPCAVVRCGAGLTCDDSSGRAECVPIDAGVRDGGTRPCAVVRCGAGLTCDDSSGTAQCVPLRDAAAGDSGGVFGGACMSDRDCRTYASNCTRCACGVLATYQSIPRCSGTPTTCFVDPCEGYSAYCAAGRCALRGP